VRAWSNGSPLRTGAGYGVRLSGRDRDKHFDPAWREVIVDLDGGESISVSLSESFLGFLPRTTERGHRTLAAPPWTRTLVARGAVGGTADLSRQQPLQATSAFLDPGQAASAGARPCGDRAYLPSWREQPELLCLLRGYGQLGFGGQGIDLGAFPLLLDDAGGNSTLDSSR
jgi:hypothetical protein